jgi:hypothetical protein
MKKARIAATMVRSKARLAKAIIEGGPGSIEMVDFD